ncbi:hypothetical protein O9993_04880 [Vibrio lentus]|nr:hypothetical protein [Vibrio lentus]
MLLTLVKMKDLSLDDRTSVTYFLDAIGVDAAKITSEEQALTPYGKCVWFNRAWY